MGHCRHFHTAESRRNYGTRKRTQSANIAAGRSTHYVKREEWVNVKLMMKTQKESAWKTKRKRISELYLGQKPSRGYNNEDILFLWWTLAGWSGKKKTGASGNASARAYEKYCRAKQELGKMRLMRGKSGQGQFRGVQKVSAIVVIVLRCGCNLFGRCWNVFKSPWQQGLWVWFMRQIPTWAVGTMTVSLTSENSHKRCWGRFQKFQDAGWFENLKWGECVYVHDSFTFALSDSFRFHYKFSEV